MSLDDLRFVGHGADGGELHACAGRAPERKIPRQGFALCGDTEGPLPSALPSILVPRVHGARLPWHSRVASALRERGDIESSEEMHAASPRADR